MRNASTIKFDIKKFDRKINFNILQNNVKDTLVQQGFLKALKVSRLEDIKEDDGNGLEKKAMSIIHLSLVSEV